MDDVQEAVQLEANLTALPPNPTDEQILQATKGFRNASVSIAIYKKLLSGGGGGGSPAGSDGEIQFNDAGAFGASPDLVFERSGGNGFIQLCTGENKTAQLEAMGLGTQLQIRAAPGDATHVGGEIGIQAGASSGQDGGEVSIEAGTDNSADGSGGAISITSGGSAVNDGGDITIRANGAGAVGWNGGDINIIAGQGGHSGGDVLLQGGGTTGNVQLYSGDSNQAVQLDNNGLNVLATKVGFYGVAPVVQPAAPVTLFDVIDALQALGLVAT